MKFFNQLLNYKFNFYSLLSILFFGFFPISIIMGNFAININIILLDILLLIYCLHSNQWKWVKEDLFRSLIILNAFLIFNSIYAFYSKFNFSYEGIIRSFTFIKFILLIYSFKILLFNKYQLDIIIKSWFVFVTIIIIDIFFEKIFGHNIIGNISPDGTRIVSFFKDELVVGSFVFCFGFSVISYFLNKNQKLNNKIFFSFFLTLIPFSIFISGERSNFIKASILFFLIIIFIDKKKLFLSKKILVFVLILFTSMVFVNNKYTFIKYSEFFWRIDASKNESSFVNKFQNIKYFAHYDTGIKIFKNYLILGVGNKNFRLECSKEKYLNEKIKYTQARCSTHPHQIYFELLSEHGLVGFIIILFIIAKFIIKNIKFCLITKDIFHSSNIFYLMLFFIPLLPGSGIFNTFNGIMFWLIFSLTNSIYENKKKNYKFKQILNEKI